MFLRTQQAMEKNLSQLQILGKYSQTMWFTNKSVGDLSKILTVLPYLLTMK